MVSRLWDYVKKRLKILNDGTCPYCGHPLSATSPECARCHLSLNFHSDDYLVDHLKNTLSSRLAWRLEQLPPDHPWSLLSLVDRELLTQESSEEDEQFVGTCKEMLNVFSMIRRVAPTDLPVLILGESGTGKELTAKAIYERSVRRDKPFVTINCAAIPETLLEAELFGYERGAFTGAYNARKGKLEQAHGGTLFLDEIGELPPSLQAKLLRYLEDKTIERIGSRTPRKVDARNIAATNHDLEKEVERGRFRMDVFYRLNAFSITLPPLRERGEDKLILAKYLLRKFSNENNCRGKRFKRETIDVIMSHEWPGNVREMINQIRRAIIVSEAEEITPEDLTLPMSDTGTATSALSLREARFSVERQKLLDVISSCGGNLSQAARLLGISRPTLYKLKRKYQL